MSAYLLIGFFIDNLKELDKLQIYGDVMVEEEVPDTNSCNHLLNEVYKNKSQKFCSECGIKVSIIKGKPAVYEHQIIGYVDNSFPPQSNCIKNCDEFCQCINCTPFDLTTYHYSPDKKCKCGSHNQYNECTCNMINYDVPITEIYGEELNYGYKLIYDNVLGPVILYKSCKIEHGNFIDAKYDDSEIKNIKFHLEEYMKKLNINGKFGIKIKITTNEPETKKAYDYYDFY